MSHIGLQTLVISERKRAFDGGATDRVGGGESDRARRMAGPFRMRFMYEQSHTIDAAKVPEEACAWINPNYTFAASCVSQARSKFAPWC